MFSYIFMKILESRPSRYDLGINILTGGHARRVKKNIVERWVKPGMEVLDIGCGTGEFMAYAAQKGAYVTGIDISERMLSVAQDRLQKGALDDRTSLYHAGIVDLEKAVQNRRFDLVVSTLVFSELYPDERRWAYQQIARVLKDSGTLVLAGEVKPKGFMRGLVYRLIRWPLAIVTYLIAQTGTKAVPDMAGEVARAGFAVVGDQRSLLGSFSTLWARKRKEADTMDVSPEKTIPSESDASILRTIWDFIGRWFPSPVDPGVRKIGSPGKNEPVLITGNFHLTVRRVEKALAGMDTWLLVAPSNGINVWCASCGGEMNSESVVSILRTSGISNTVSHRKIILPQFCAPAVDILHLKQETGFNAIFGPAYAKDLPKFLKEKKKSKGMCVVNYPLLFRLEMLVSMNTLIWALISVVILLLNPTWFFAFSLLFWGAGLILYGGYPWLPGNSGWLKGLGLAAIVIVGIASATYILGFKVWFAHWGWMLAAIFVCFWLGFDLRGIVEGSASEASGFLEKIGVHSIGKLYSSHSKTRGFIHRDNSLCTHCGTCMGICPKGVFDYMETEKRVFITDPKLCFSCGACAFQCPEKALEIT